MAVIAATTKPRAKDPVSAKKMVDHAIAKFGFAVIAAKLDWSPRKGELISWFCGSSLPEPLVCLGSARLIDWQAQADLTNERWPGFIGAAGRRASAHKFYKVTWEDHDR